MAVKPHPRAFEQSFRLGEAVVLFFFQAEYCWLHASDPDTPVPEIVDTRLGQLRQLISDLRRLFHPRARKHLWDGLLLQFDSAWQEYVCRWGSAEHRDAIDRMRIDRDSEWDFDLVQNVVRKSPVASPAWHELREKVSKIMDALPPILRDLARLGELATKSSWWSTTDPDESERNTVSQQQFVTVIVNERLQKSLRGLRRKLPAIRGIECNLAGMEFDQALSSLNMLRSQLLNELQRHATELENPLKARAVAVESEPHLKPCEKLAIQSYNFAIENMDLSESSSVPTDKDVWHWLRENSDDEMPSFENWSRYLRAARRAHELPRKNARRIETSRSVVRAEEVYSERGNHE